MDLFDELSATFERAVGADDDDSLWSSARDNIDRASMFLRYVARKDEWKSFDAKKRKEFLQGYLFSCIKSLHNRKLHDEKNVYQYIGPNTCKNCSKWLPDVASANMDFMRDMPKMDYIEEWIDWRCKSPKELVTLSKIVLKSIAPMLDTSDVKPFGIRLEADLTTYAIGIWHRSVLLQRS